MDELNLNEQVVFEEDCNEISIIDEPNKNLIASTSESDNQLSQSIKTNVTQTNVTKNQKSPVLPNTINNIIITLRNSDQLKKPITFNSNQTPDKQQKYQIIRLVSPNNNNQSTFIQLPSSTSLTPNLPISVGISPSISLANQPKTHKSYVPILPNPSTNLNSTNSNSTANKSKLIIANFQNGPKISSTNETQINELATQNVANPRKPCNCTRSQCLKLYCDCFAAGEFCQNCNCQSCFNNLDHEEHRQKAIKQCIDRNPHAFHPKIGKGKTTAQDIERRHTKGCNCRRSGCLKNYCECYEAKILCTNLCKCCACKNYEDSYERKSLMHLVDAVDIRSTMHSTTTGNFGKENDPLWSNEFRSKLPVPSVQDRVLSCSFITNDLVDAAAQCLIAQAEKSQKIGLNTKETEKAIIKEFGSCLTQIINATNR